MFAQRLWRHRLPSSGWWQHIWIHSGIIIIFNKNRFRDSAAARGKNLHLEVFNVCRMIISNWMISPVLRKCTPSTFYSSHHVDNIPMNKQKRNSFLLYVYFYFFQHTVHFPASGEGTGHRTSHVDAAIHRHNLQSSRSHPGSIGGVTSTVPFRPFRRHRNQ